MNVHDATETAYKNGYTQGTIDATEHIKARLEELIDDLSYDMFYYKDYISMEHIQLRLKNILDDL